MTWACGAKTIPLLMQQLSSDARGRCLEQAHAETAFTVALQGKGKRSDLLRLMQLAGGDCPGAAEELYAV